MTVDPSKKPTNIDPQSPIKIDAGLKLKTRNPSKAPINTAIKSRSSVCPLPAKLSPSDTAPMVAIPAARPSMLSSRLMALVMPISQKTVIQISTIS